jgi:hypothetical protein
MIKNEQELEALLQTLDAQLPELKTQLPEDSINITLSDLLTRLKANSPAQQFIGESQPQRVYMDKILSSPQALTIT